MGNAGRPTHIFPARSRTRLLSVGLFALLCAEAAAAAPPNVVFILLDDAGYGDLGAYGSRSIQTPRIDALAREGMRFTHSYAGAPLCSPSRVALLTGRHPVAYGFRRIITRESGRGLPADAPSLARVLAAAGYATGHFGKWHLGQLRKEYLPNHFGFERSVIRMNLEGTEHENGKYWNPTLLIDEREEIQARGHLTELTTDHALEFITEHRDGPFFANLWYHAPHPRWQPPERWAARYPDTADGRYAALLSHADEQIGRIVDRLGELGIDHETLVVVASDNGGKGTGLASNGNLRGRKRQVYEGGIRVPTLVRWDGRVAPGSVNPSTIHFLDWLPTLAALAGVDVSDLDLAGRSLLPALLDSQVLEPGPTSFWEAHDPKVTPGSPDTAWNVFAVRQGRWKLVQQNDDRSPEPSLYDLERDPRETADLAAARPEIAARLHDEYRTWRRRAGRIDFVVASVAGAVAREADAFAFRGGHVDLGADPRLDVGDGDLSFRARLRVDAIGAPQVIAQKADSWELALDALGRATLRLWSRAAQAPATLSSQAPLAAGREYELTFTLRGGKTNRSAARLYVDRMMQGGSYDVAQVQVSEAPVRLGNDRRGARALHGRLRDVAFYSLSLTESEVAASAPDARQRAPEEHDPWAVAYLLLLIGLSIGWIAWRRRQRSLPVE